MKRNLFNRLTRRNSDRQDIVYASGTLASGDTYEIRRLDHRHLDAIYAFHLAIHASLKEEERTFISHKTRADFESYLNGKGEILGAVDNHGRMIGLGCLLLPKSGCTELGLADMKVPYNADNIAVLQSDSVLPPWRGNGLQHKLAEARIALAASVGRKHVFALADTKNLATIKSLLKSGLAITGMGVDPDDGGNVFHMQGIIRKRGCTPSLKISLR